MSDKSEQIKELIKKSKEVILSCCLENGAIVAANSDKPYYPKEAYNYRYVWPRDASFIIHAANILGIRNIQEPFFDWLLGRAENFSNDGLLFQNYYPNGLKRWLNFQPDQNASIIWAIFDSKKEEKYKDVVKLLADGILRTWDRDHFTIKTQDLWEERETFPDLKDNHTYSLAACAHSLELASKIIDNKEYLKAQIEMLNQIKYAYKDGYFHRSVAQLGDPNVDASMLGLIWPFEIIKPDGDKAINTVKKIEEKLAKDGGIRRYEFDYYDGWRYHGTDRRKGSGAWPILNFWLAVALARQKDKAKARIYYDWVLNNIKEDNLIPEQIFANKIQVSVKPLAWSHAMFIIATKELGLI